MARQDIAGLLTGISSTQQPVQPVPGTPGFRGQFGAARAQGLGAGIGGLMRGGAPSTQERIQGAISQLDLNNPDDLATLAKVQQARGDLAGAAQTASKIEALKQYKEKLDLEERRVAADELSAATSGRSSSPFQFGASKTYKDSKGNYYLGTQKRTVGTGEVETVLSPVAGAPAKPQGAVEEVGAYGQTATEMIEGRIDVKGRSTKAELFEKRKDTAATDFSLSSKNVLDADRMLRALDNITTGGFVPETAKLVTDFLGKTPADVGEFEILAKEQMIAKLSAFGANPTEGEARRAAELVPAIRKSEGLNRRLVQSFREEMKRRRDNSAYLLGPDASVEGYRQFSLDQYEGVGEEGKVINFEDLK